MLQVIFINVPDGDYSNRKMDLKCIFRINLGISGELRMRAPSVCCLQALAVLAAVQFRVLLSISQRDWAAGAGLESLV